MTPDLPEILGSLPDQDLIGAFSKEIFRRGLTGIFYSYDRSQKGFHFIAAPQSVFDLNLSVGDQLRMFGSHADVSVVGVERVSTEKAKSVLDLLSVPTSRGQA